MFLEMLTYPVSIVMKAWHLLFTEVFHVGPSAAWVIAVVGLVFTVRGILFPFYWMQKRAVHKANLMRPEKAEIDEKYGTSAEPEDIIAHQEKTKELNKKYEYNPFLGCVPIFIQLPVIIGLYRLLLWISRPELLGNHGNSSGGIGVLSGDDMASFADARLFGVPLPAYIAMSDERLQALGTTSADAFRVIFPFVLIAMVFTTANMLVTNYFNFKYIDWTSRVARTLLPIMLGLSLFMPIFIYVLGVHGILPFALVLYWVTGNLWTTLQTLYLNITMARRWPESEEHHELRKASRQKLIDARKQRRARRAEDKAFIRSASERGSTRSEARAELKRRDAEEKAAQEAEKAEKKALKQKRSKVQSQITAERMRKRREERAAAKAAKGGSNGATDEAVEGPKHRLKD